MNANPAPTTPNPNGQTPPAPAEPVKPWVARPNDTLTAFWCDDGAVYYAQHGQLSAKSLALNRLEIKAPPHGVIVALGPAARDLGLALCSNRATLIRADGTDLTSVTLLREPEAAAETMADRLDRELEPDPDPEEAEAEVD